MKGTVTNSQNRAVFPTSHQKKVDEASDFSKASKFPRDRKVILVKPKRNANTQEPMAWLWSTPAVLCWFVFLPCTSNDSDRIFKTMRAAIWKKLEVKSNTNCPQESYLAECDGVDTALDTDAELMLWLRVELTLERSMSPFPQDTLLSDRLLPPPMSSGLKFSSPEPTSTSDPPELFFTSTLFVQCHVILVFLFCHTEIVQCMLQRQSTLPEVIYAHISLYFHSVLK